MDITLLHAGLAAGAALAALPVILHLFMKQKPKRIIFPALRLIRERQKRAKKQLKIKNWLLLSARMLLLILMALALAQPTINSETVSYTHLPSYEEEKKILSATTKGDTADLKKILSAKAIINLQKLVTSVPISDYAVEYVTRLVRATRPADDKTPKFVKELVDYGAGPRAGQNLILGGKAMAAMDGRFSVSIDDIRKVAVPVLRHRISTNFQAQAEGQTTESLIKRLIAETKEPDIPKYAKA